MCTKYKRCRGHVVNGKPQKTKLERRVHSNMSNLVATHAQKASEAEQGNHIIFFSPSLKPCPSKTIYENIWDQIFHISY